MIVAGIDIGLKGSLALIKSENEIIFMDFKDDLLRGYIYLLKKFTPDLVVIEDVHSMPNQGVKSMFSFGQRLGEIEGMLMTLNIPYEKVRPQKWQQNLGIGSKCSKKDIAEVIIKRYPNAELYGKKGGLLDGRSDALGIAHYGRVKYVQGIKTK